MTDTASEQPSATGRASAQPSATENAYGRSSDPETYKKIIGGITYDNALGTNRLNPVASRAVPNQRLVQTIEIDNGFTTSDSDHRNRFGAEASKRLFGATGKGWMPIADIARDKAETYAEKIAGQGKASLEKIVQIFSLKIVFEVFFGLDGEVLEDDTMLRIAQQINLLRIRSKSESESNAASIELLRPYFHRLGLNWTGRRDNPLSLLLPVYETL